MHEQIRLKSMSHPQPWGICAMSNLRCKILRKLFDGWTENIHCNVCRVRVFGTQPDGVPPGAVGVKNRRVISAEDEFVARRERKVGVHGCSLVDVVSAT